MTPYFDVDDRAHLALLPPEVQNRADLAGLAADCEARVVGYYTRRPLNRLATVAAPIGLPEGITPSAPLILYLGTGQTVTDLGNGTMVFLTGFKPDAADPQVDPLFAADLRREIADVIAWRAAQYGRELGVAAEGGSQKRTVTYAIEAGATFPPTFGAMLAKYDSRPSVVMV